MYGFFLLQGGQILQNAGNGMFQVVQPMQTVTVDGQEALFIPNMNASANQLNGAQPIQIGSQQAFITPNGQIIRTPNVMPANILQNMGQTVSLPTGKHCFSMAAFHFKRASKGNIIQAECIQTMASVI